MCVCFSDEFHAIHKTDYIFCFPVPSPDIPWFQQSVKHRWSWQFLFAVQWAWESNVWLHLCWNLKYCGTHNAVPKTPFIYIIKISIKLAWCVHIYSYYTRNHFSLLLKIFQYFTENFCTIIWDNNRKTPDKCKTLATETLKIILNALCTFIFQM